MVFAADPPEMIFWVWLEMCFSICVLVFLGGQSHAALGDFQLPYQVIRNLHFDIHQRIADTHQIVVHRVSRIEKG